MFSNAAAEIKKKGQNDFRQKLGSVEKSKLSVRGSIQTLICSVLTHTKDIIIFNLESRGFHLNGGLEIYTIYNLNVI